MNQNFPLFILATPCRYQGMDLLCNCSLITVCLQLCLQHPYHSLCNFKVQFCKLQYTVGTREWTYGIFVFNIVLVPGNGPVVITSFCVTFSLYPHHIYMQYSFGINENERAPGNGPLYNCYLD